MFGFFHVGFCCVGSGCVCGRVDVFLSLLFLTFAVLCCAAVVVVLWWRRPEEQRASQEAARESTTTGGVERSRPRRWNGPGTVGGTTGPVEANVPRHRPGGTPFWAPAWWVGMLPAGGMVGMLPEGGLE